MQSSQMGTAKHSILPCGGVAAVCCPIDTSTGTVQPRIYLNLVDVSTLILTQENTTRHKDSERRTREQSFVLYHHNTPRPLHQTARRLRRSCSIRSTGSTISVSHPLRQRRGGPSSSATSTIDLSVEETGGGPPIIVTMEDFDTLRREATKLERHLEDRVSRYQQVRTLYVDRVLLYFNAL
jgi:hypothetical protein